MVATDFRQPLSVAAGVCFNDVHIESHGEWGTGEIPARYMQISLLFGLGFPFCIVVNFLNDLTQFVPCLIVTICYP